MKKDLGQFFTPSWIVVKMLDDIKYNNKDILHKTIMEPSFGDGAFLQEIVERYINIAIKHNWNAEQIKNGLEQYIYGIEYDKRLVLICENKLNDIASKYKIYNVKWNLLNKNSLSVDLFNFKMEFVVGNPPYIRVHNIPDDIKYIMKSRYHFCQHGLSDIYVAFYELGINMLTTTGKLSFITPNSFMYNTSAKDFRNHLIKEKLLSQLINFNTHQVFSDASTYATIMYLDKQHNASQCDYHSYNGKDIEYIGNINLSDFTNQSWTFSSQENIDFLYQQTNKETKLSDEYNVQHGFATLRDKLYISNQVDKIDDTYSYFNGFKIESALLYPIVKGSKYDGRDITEYIIYPYRKINNKWEVILEDELQYQYPYVYQYFLHHKDDLIQRSIDKNAKTWYQFGRSQGIQTMFVKKLVINSFLKKGSDKIQVYSLPENVFVYSGIFATGENLDKLYNTLISDDFCKYVSIVGKDLRNGYKTFTAKMIKNYTY